MTGRKHLMAVIGGLMVLGSAGAALVAPAPTKDLLLAADAAVFDGTLRRLYHGQSRPDLTGLDGLFAGADYDWLGPPESRTVAHAGGSYPGLVPNTGQAVQASLARGLTLIELDIRLTTDGSLIVYHGPQQPLSLAEAREQGDAAIMSVADLLDLLPADGSVHVVLDIKDDFASTLVQIKRTAGDKARYFIPQVYDFSQARFVQTLGGFSGPIFTSYLSALTTEQILTAARVVGFKAVTLTYERFQTLDPGWRHGRGPMLYVHGQPPDVAPEVLLEQGAWGVYQRYFPASAGTPG